MRISDWRSDVYSSDLRMPRFGARLSAFRCGWREEPGRPGCPVLPEFIARENRARAEGPSRKKCGVGAARSRRRGHGHARLDGSQARATVAGMAMKERKDGDRQRASLCADHTQVKRAGPKLEAGPQESAMEARRGETPQATRCVARQRAPAVPFGRETPMPQ